MRRRPAWIVSEVGTTKGWVCRVTEEDNDWLGLHDWAPYKRSMDGKVRPVVQQGIDLLWVQVTTSAECTKSVIVVDEHMPWDGLSWGQKYTGGSGGGKAR
jgi:hypothetical protein